MFNLGRFGRRDSTAEAARLFAPCMPEVKWQVDIAEIFAKARSLLATDRPTKDFKAGQRGLAIVTPDREVALIGGPMPGTAPAQFAATARRVLPFKKPLNITAVGFTGLQALNDPSDLLQLPFVAMLLSFPYVGHSVVVFEGHSSALEASLQDADVLLVDSAMLPLLRPDWFDIAWRAFGGKGRVRVFDRPTTEIQAAVPSHIPPGWEYATERDGPHSYVNALLTTLGKRSPVAVDLNSTEPLPDLSTFPTAPEEIDWTSKLPFQYDALDPAEVIQVIADTPKMNWSPSGGHETTATVNMLLLETGGQQKTVTFRFVLTTGANGQKALRTERVG